MNRDIFYSKMMQKIVMFITILAIFEQNKCVRCDNYISVIMQTFNNDKFDESNLMCYLSLYALIKYKFEYPDIPINETVSDLFDLSTRLFRVNGWTKYFTDLGMIWTQFINLKNWNTNYNDMAAAEIVWYDALFLVESSTVLKNSLYVSSAKLFIDNIFNYHVIIATFSFCKKTLMTLSEPSSFLENILQEQFIQNAAFLNTTPPTELPVQSIFGSVLLLMNQGDYNKFIGYNNDQDKMIYLVNLILDELEEIHKGILYVLRKVDSVTINVDEFQKKLTFLEILKTTFDSAADLSKKMYYLKNLHSIKKKCRHTLNGVYRSKSAYRYEAFRDMFKMIFWYKVNKNETRNHPVSILNDGRIIKNDKVELSLINYYQIFDDSIPNFYDIDYRGFESDIVLLMELNAWMKLLYSVSLELYYYLNNNSRNIKEIPKSFPSFDDDKMFIKNSLEQFVQT